jgi:hypothetical protein
MFNFIWALIGAFGTCSDKHPRCHRIADELKKILVGCTITITGAVPESVSNGIKLQHELSNK